MAQSHEAFVWFIFASKRDNHNLNYNHCDVSDLESI